MIDNSMINDVYVRWRVPADLEEDIGEDGPAKNT
jgi:hypothetical protein